MWQFLDGTEFLTMNIIPGNLAFNYFFTIVSIFGIISFGVAAMMRVITRS